jgi:hypothetical protein
MAILTDLEAQLGRMLRGVFIPALPKPDDRQPQSLFNAEPTGGEDEDGIRTSIYRERTTRDSGAAGERRRHGADGDTGQNRSPPPRPPTRPRGACAGGRTRDSGTAGDAAIDRVRRSLDEVRRDGQAGRSPFSAE